VVHRPVQCRQIDISNLVEKKLHADGRHTITPERRRLQTLVDLFPDGFAVHAGAPQYGRRRHLLPVKIKDHNKLPKCDCCTLRPPQGRAVALPWGISVEGDRRLDDIIGWGFTAGFHG